MLWPEPRPDVPRGVDTLSLHKVTGSAFCQSRNLRRSERDKAMGSPGASGSPSPDSMCPMLPLTANMFSYRDASPHTRIKLKECVVWR